MNSGFDEVMILQTGFPSFGKCSQIAAWTISNLYCQRGFWPAPAQRSIWAPLHRSYADCGVAKIWSFNDHWFNADCRVFYTSFSQMWRWHGLRSTSKDLLFVCWNCSKYLRFIDVCVCVFILLRCYSCSGAINILLYGDIVEGVMMFLKCFLLPVWGSFLC